jgi:hypothetical protein
MGEAGRRLVHERYQLSRTIESYYDRYAAAAGRFRVKGGVPMERWSESPQRGAA